MKSKNSIGKWTLAALLGYELTPVFRRSTRKFPAFLFFSFFVSSSVPRFFLYLQQIFNALSGLFLLEKFF